MVKAAYVVFGLVYTPLLLAWIGVVEDMFVRGVYRIGVQWDGVFFFFFFLIHYFLVSRYQSFCLGLFIAFFFYTLLDTFSAQRFI